MADQESFKTMAARKVEPGHSMIQPVMQRAGFLTQP
jgi:hypothetical protein